MKSNCSTPFFSLALISILSLFYHQTVKAQVTVSGAAPASNGTYATLGDAFTAINGQSQTGNAILITITADFVETGADLNAGTWTSLTIQPSGSRTITGSHSTGLIELWDADFVTFNGLNTGGNSLTISNTSTSNNAATIKLWQDATNNTITNCTVLGSSLGVAGTLGTTVTGGNIVFQKSIAGGTGTDNNTISNNNLGPAGATLPACLIRGYNSTTSWSTASNGNVVSGNNFYDYFHSSLESSAIHISAYNNDWTISNNKFFQTTPKTHSTGKRHSAIFISANHNGSVITSGLAINSFNITENTFGFANSTGTGTYIINGISNSMVDMIYLCVGDQGTSITNIDGNTFANIAMNGSSLGNGTSAPLKMINIYKGDVNVGVNSGNTFGSQSTTGSISFTTSANTTVTNIYCILVDRISTGGVVTIANNNFGSISASCTHATPISTSIFVVSTGTTVNGSLTIQNNIIGGTVPNSIQNTSTSTNPINSVVGIFVIPCPSTISDNTIRNLTCNGGTGNGSNGPLTSISSVIGIAVRNNYTHTISHNTIYSLHNTHISAATIVTGIEFSSGASGSIVERNMIHSLTASNTSAIINGVHVSNTNGPLTVKNNMISLGLFENGSSLSIGMNINGINENSAVTQVNAFYFNSIQIAGSAVSGSQPTYAFYSNKGSLTKNIRNNIFFSKRSNGAGTGNHFSIRILNISSLTIDYNDYQVTGTGGILGRINATNYTTLADWQTATGQDANSITPFSPVFVSDNDLHLQTTGNTPLIAGLTIAGITTDIDPDTRASTPTIGADEIITGLPATIFGLRTECENDQNVVKWGTFSEQNTWLFSVERTYDGNEFETIGTLEAAGNSSMTIEYAFVDPTLIDRISYYRLKQIDNDGVYTYTNLVEAACYTNSTENSTIKLYPNPTVDHLIIDSKNEISEINLFNQLGEFMSTFEVNDKFAVIELKDYPAGLYFIQLLDTSGNVQLEKIIKQ